MEMEIKQVLAVLKEFISILLQKIWSLLIKDITTSEKWINQVFIFISENAFKKIIKNQIIKKGYVSTIAGNGTQGKNDGQGTLAQFWSPFCVTADSIGNIYVGDYCAIRMINSTGLICFGDIWYRKQ